MVGKDHEDSGPPVAEYRSTLWDREGLWPGGDGVTDSSQLHHLPDAEQFNLQS